MKILYKENNLGELFKIPTNEIVEKIDGNILFEEFKEYLSKDGEVEFYKIDIPIEIPQTISMMKLRIQLILMGTSMENILDTIIKLPTEMLPEIQKKLILVKLEYATHLERYSPELVNLGKIMFTENQLDYIFIEGNKL